MNLGKEYQFFEGTTINDNFPQRDINTIQTQTKHIPECKYGCYLRN